MAKSIKVHPKKGRGRPATGKDPLVSARLPQDAINRIERWATERDLSRSEAIRLLLEMALPGGDGMKRSPRQPAAAKARDLASKTIDKLIDPSAPADEKAVRKRRLLKGPSDFRDVRVDREK